MVSPFVRPHGLRPALSAPELARALGLSDAESREVERDMHMSVRAALAHAPDAEYAGARSTGRHGLASVIAESAGHGRHARGRARTPRPGKLVGARKATGEGTRRPVAKSAPRRSGARGR